MDVFIVANVNTEMPKYVNGMPLVVVEVEGSP